MLPGAMDTAGIPETVTFQSSKPATWPPPLEALSAFVQAIDGACYPSPRLPAWWLATAIKTFDGLCAYCGRETGSEPDIDAVIPLEAGGPQRPDAAVLICKVCKQARRRRDLLLWEASASTKLRTMRAELALNAWNHLSRDPAAMQTPEKATDVIQARWRHPRFHCHGALLPTGGFIGWRQTSLVPSAMQMRMAATAIVKACLSTEQHFRHLLGAYTRRRTGCVVGCDRTQRPSASCFAWHYAAALR
jgi:hypothetical protein